MTRRAPSGSTWSALVGDRDEEGLALVDEQGCWTVGELLSRAAGAAAWMDEVGLPVGRPVPALLSTTRNAFPLLLAGAATGRPLAPLGPRLAPTEIAACLSGLQAEVLLAAPEHRASAEQAAGLAGCAMHETVAVAESGKELPRPSEDAIAFVMHTSGTSGQPKPVPARQDRMAARARVNRDLLAFDAESIYLTASPFHHVAGVGMLAVALGSPAAVACFAQFTVQAWESAQALGVTHALLVPSMVEMLLDEGNLRPGALRRLQYGGAPMHPDTLRRIMSVLPDVALLQLYGQTEGSPVTALTPQDHVQAASDRPELLRSVGRAAPGATVELRDRDDEGVGEVCGRAEQFFRTDDDGWMRTGDLGRFDDDGYLYLLGRKGDMIIRGGENVHPLEVEQVLARHDGVREAAVVGRPDRRLGQTVHAVVVAEDPASPPSEDALRAHVRAELSGFKTPTSWSFVDELPRNQAGKVVRRDLSPEPTDAYGASQPRYVGRTSRGIPSRRSEMRLRCTCADPP